MSQKHTLILFLLPMECSNYLEDVLRKLADDTWLAPESSIIRGAWALGRGKPGRQGQAKNCRNNFHFSLFDVRVKRSHS